MSRSDWALSGPMHLRRMDSSAALCSPPPASTCGGGEGGDN